jgi:hypothetical protein
MGTQIAICCAKTRGTTLDSTGEAAFALGDAWLQWRHEITTGSMGDLQDPKMEVLYHIRPYSVGIFPEI